MKVRVRFYGVAFEAAGRREVEVAMPGGSTLGGLLEALAGAHPALKPLLFDGENPRDYLVFAVNQRDAALLDGWGTVLKDGDQVSLMPPIGGGC